MAAGLNFFYKITLKEKNIKFKIPKRKHTRKLPTIFSRSDLIKLFDATDSKITPEIADIFCKYGKAYIESHPIPLEHYKIMNAIVVCRTASLGGHVEVCDSCGKKQNSYNSCRNRHCPKCQALTKARWLEAMQAELLSVPYSHNVFTLPHDLNLVILCNKKIMLRIQKPDTRRAVR